MKSHLTALKSQNAVGNVLNKDYKTKAIAHRLQLRASKQNQLLQRALKPDSNRNVVRTVDRNVGTAPANFHQQKT